MSNLYQSIIYKSQKGITIDKIFYDLKKHIDITDFDNFNNTVIRRSEGKASIGIKEVEQLTNWNSKKDAKLKIAVIFEAELMTNQAQNSILKIVEEPNPNNLLILETQNINSILQTIKSRCKIMNSSEELQINTNFDEDFVTNYLNSNYIDRVGLLNNKFQESSENNNKMIGDFIEHITYKIVELNANKAIENFDNMVELLEFCKILANRSVNIKLLNSYLSSNL